MNQDTGGRAGRYLRRSFGHEADAQDDPSFLAALPSSVRFPESGITITYDLLRRGSLLFSVRLQERSGQSMLSRGPAKKVTIYVNEDTRHHMDALWSAVLHFLRSKHVAGATVLRAVAGFGAHQVLHSMDQEQRMEHMPMRIEFIDSAPRVDELLPALYDMVEDGIIEVQDTNIVKAVVKGRKPSEHTPHREISGPARLIRIYLGESDTVNGEPLFDAIVKKLMMMEVAGATVYRAIFGYGAKRHKHQQRFLISRDCPIMISVVEQPGRVDEIIDAVAPMMQDGLIVISDVEIHRFTHALPGNTGTNAS